MKKLSVIVPVYNVEDYVDQCLSSLLNQGLEDMEIIVINDGSTDGTREIAEEYQRRYPHEVIVKTIENSGAGGARNVGLTLAGGEYVGFVDGDDCASPTMFEKLYHAAHKADADIACCGYRRIDGGDIQNRGTGSRDARVYGTDIFTHPDILVHSTPYLWNKIFRRSMIEAHDAKFESFRIYEDLIFTYQMFLRANRIMYVAQPLYYYMFSRGGSLTSRFSEKRLDLMPAFDCLYAYYEGAGCARTLNRELLFILMKHIYVVCEENVRRGMRRQKLRFINESFAYLRKKFPDFAADACYYEVYGNHQKLYENKVYWCFRTVLPQIPRIRAGLGKLKRSMQFSRSGCRYWRAYRKERVRKDRILVQSQQGTNLNGNMFYLLRELCTNSAYASFEIGVTYADGHREAFERLVKQYGLDRKGIVFLRLHSREYVRYLASACYLLNDTSYATYFIKKSGQRYLNTWHGTPLKALGRSTARDYFDIGNLQKTFMQSDVLLYPSGYMRDVMKRDYMLCGARDTRAWLCGYPRNEVFFSKERAEAVRKALSLGEKQVIAYMPTWRGTVREINYGQNGAIAQMLQKLDEGLCEDQILYVNLHPYMEDQADYGSYRRLRRFPLEYETYDMLNVCDVLVTDYSSVFFDYGVSGKPVILFTYDKEEYLKERGMYIDMDTLPYPQVGTVKELLEALSEPKQMEAAEFQEYQKTYAPYERASMSADICRQFILEEDAGISQEKLDDGKCENVLIFADSFQQLKSQRSLLNLVPNSGSPNRNYYITYVLEMIKGNQEALRKLPENVYYMGTMNPFQTQTLWESFLMARLEEGPLAYSLFHKRVDTMMRRECLKSWQGLNITGALAFGRMQIRDIAVAASLPGRKVLYFDSLESVKPALSARMLQKFDRIIAADETVREAAMKIKNAAGLKVEVVESLRSLEDLY